MKKSVLLSGILCLLLALSCTQNNQAEKDAERSIDDLKFNPVMVSVVDHFIEDVKHYSYLDAGESIQLIGYLSFEESDDPKQTKIRIEGIHQFTTELSTLKADDYFVRSGIFFLVNYNDSTTKHTGNGVDLDEIIAKSKINRYNGSGTRKPCWLVQIAGEKVSKVYKYADSYFGKKQEKECRTSDSGIECFQLNEWGELLDDKGIVFDSLGGRSDYRW